MVARGFFSSEMHPFLTPGSVGKDDETRPKPPFFVDLFKVRTAGWQWPPLLAIHRLAQALLLVGGLRPTWGSESAASQPDRQRAAPRRGARGHVCDHRF